MTDDLPECWAAALKHALTDPSFGSLTDYVTAERREHSVFPPTQDVLNALRMTPLNQVKAVILGQDPYHGESQAHGLSFSVRPEVPIPPSLKNIFKELESDLGLNQPVCGDLTSWATQGILLLNTVLTVRAGEAHSHRKHGWEQFTDAVFEAVNQRPFVVFLLWGRPAQQKRPVISDRHCVIESAHPSPLSARRGFFGSRPFSRCNAALEFAGESTIQWQLPTADR